MALRQVVQRALPGSARCPTAVPVPLARNVAAAAKRSTKTQQTSAAVMDADAKVLGAWGTQVLSALPPTAEDLAGA